MTSPLDGFREFCGQLRIPSKDHGLVPLAPLWGTQDYLLRQIEAGLERGVHSFVPLKGRQEGITTLCDALDIYWPQKFSGVLGMVVLDDDPNIKFRRDIIKQMLVTLPKAYRHGVRVDNEGMLAFAPNARTGFTGSRLMFAAAGKRSGSNLGRSRGLNYAHGDELAWWQDQRAFSAFQSSLSEHFPWRLYTWPSTANGDNLFKDLYRTAERVPDMQAIFVGPWLHTLYRLTPARADLWDRYGAEPPTPEELTYLKIVHHRYGVKVPFEFVAWRRWQLESKYNGDEAMLAQEFPWLPEDAFQYFGDQFIEPHVVRKLRAALDGAEPPAGYRYEWGDYLNDLRVKPDDPDTAPLQVWEEADPGGLYIVAAHPQYASSERSREFVVQVWRVYPERIAQVAEYAADQGYMHKFGWVILHMCAAYRTWMPATWIMELEGPGIAAYDEIKNLESFGRGLRADDDRSLLLNAVGGIEYLYYKIDNFSQTVLPQMKSHVQERMRLLYNLRDDLERGYMTPRSPDLIDQFASLRRGEDGDSDTVAGGGDSQEGRAWCAALAGDAWRRMQNFGQLLAPEKTTTDQSPRVENVLVRDFIGGLGRK